MFGETTERIAIWRADRVAAELGLAANGTDRATVRGGLFRQQI